MIGNEVLLRLNATMVDGSGAGAAASSAFPQSLRQWSFPPSLPTVSRCTFEECDTMIVIEARSL